MAKNTQPIAKRCRALGISPAVMGYGKKTTNRNPGGQMRKKKSEYATQLNEKQKVKFVYGILENQFHTYYEKASRMPVRPVSTCWFWSSAVSTTSSTVWALPRPAATPASWFPTTTSLSMASVSTSPLTRSRRAM